MYLFVYKTTHINGRYYIGRHSTNNLEDGYFGSGKWIDSIKDKSTLTREIIAEATSFEELCKLEEYHIGLYFGKPGCMNYKRASVGWSSEDATEINIQRVEDGTHPWLGPEHNRKRVADGTHPFLGGEIPREVNRKRLEDGTHHFYGPSVNLKRVANGIHPFLSGEIAKESNRRRLADGTHHLLGGEISREINRRRVEDGTHQFLGENAPSQQKWTCPHCSKSGKGKGNFTRFHGDNCKHKSKE